MRGKLAYGLIIILASCLSEDVVSPQEQLRRDINAIDAYLFENNINAIKDESGLRFVVFEIGTNGVPPNEWNNIELSYTGRLLSNGAQFDQNNSFSLSLTDNLILGWKIGLPLLPAGSKATLYIPSVYAYGDRGNSSIPKNANLIFDIDLKSVEMTPQQTTLRGQDIILIDNYLSENDITNTTVHESGIRYIIENEGIGNPPSWYDKVKVTYSAKLLNGTTPFFTETREPATGFSSRLVNFPPNGLKIAMQLLRPEGGKGIFYVPSVFAYGPRSYTNVPANSIVVYEVELHDIIQ
jgi:FKBP-type peptidyl-prolyl cis-trans isomerase FkpA